MTMAARSDIVRIARTYLGTPFHHRGRTPGVALDCAGLLVCDARELGLVSADFDVPSYTATPDGTMIEWCDRYMGARATKKSMQPGDAICLITQREPGAPEQHLGILADYRHGGLSIIHASNDRLHKGVIEHRLIFSPAFRFAAAWSFPGIQ
jgi:hypothetical protein